MNLFRQLKHLPADSIWAFVNNAAKYAYISYSEDTLGAIARHIRLIKEGVHPCQKLNKHHKSLHIKILSVLNVETTEECRRLYLHYFVDKYKKMGYKMYRPYKGLVYKPHIFFKAKDVCVSLRNKRGSNTVVGLFSTMSDAEEFVKQYLTRDVIFPVYALNKRTREWILENDR